MAFTEDLSVFLNTDDFAVEAILKIGATETPVNVIFDSPTLGVDIYDAQIETDHFYLLIRQSDLGAAKKNDEFIIDSVTYKIGQIRHDGTGMSIVYLKI